MNDIAHHVSAVSDLDDLSELEDPWQAVHRADPEATVFTSWPWMRGRFATLPDPWHVLVVRSADGRIDGLLPLRFSSAEGEADARPTLAMAGSSLADYTGFLCVPEVQEQVLAALASYVQDHLDWQHLEIRDTRDTRLEAFLSLFPPRPFEI